jgi:sugar/nucleoside kinase (ribokinase family)
LFAGDLTLALGGSAIVATGLHRLGARVGLIADLGNDPFSRVTAQLLEEMGLDCSLIRRHPHPLPQLTVALSFPKDRAFITRFKQPETPPDLTAILQAHATKHLHVCSYLAALETPDACQIAHAAGATISMDPGWDEQALLNPRLSAMIADLDFFLPSRSELCHIARNEDADQAARQILDTMPHGMIVMKNGQEGAESFSHHEQDCIQIPAIPVTPIDTTGAGDAFDAGFLYAYTRGNPLKNCMQVGAVCGGLTTTAKGGATATPTFKEMEKWLSKLPS